jgi:hypothetical protein
MGLDVTHQYNPSYHVRPSALLVLALAGGAAAFQWVVVKARREANREAVR